MRRGQKQHNTHEPASILGRPLLVFDRSRCVSQFLSRNDIPSAFPMHCVASEPFTLMGINPDAKKSDIIKNARQSSEKWLTTLPNVPEYERERTGIKKAVEILSTEAIITQYRGFAKDYEQKRKKFSRDDIVSLIMKKIVSQSPTLRKRWRDGKRKSSGIFGSSFLVSIAFLIALFTVHVGGVTILGFTLFSTTLFAYLGPLALLPISVLLLFGGFMAHLYKQHTDVFRELHKYLSPVIVKIEAVAYAVEDVFFLQRFEVFRHDSTEIRKHQKEMYSYRDKFMKDFIGAYTEAFNKELSRLVQEHEGKEQMTADCFFSILRNHPGELEKCFQQPFVSQVTKLQLPV